MEENNLNSNNQMETNNNINESQSNKSNNKVLLVLMALIIVGLVGYIISAKFMDKNGKEEPKPNDTQENSNNETENNETNEQENNNTEEKENSTQNEQPTTVDKNVYKTADGKHTLNVKDFNNKSNPKLVYDGKTIKVASDDGGIYGYYETKGKYGIYSDGNGQCGTYFFVVNTENNTLVNLDNKKYNHVEQIGNNYYFVQKEFCGGDGFDIYTAVYTENLKKIGTAYFDRDENNNFYVLNDGYVVKYDQNANEISRSSKKYEQKKIIDWYSSNVCEPVIANNTLYFAYFGDNNIEYLVDIANNKEIQINKKTDSEYKMSFYGCSYDSGPNKFIFEYDLESCGSGCWSDRLTYTYDINTDSFTSKTEKTESESYTE